MNIKKLENGSDLTIELEGRLDTSTAPELEYVLMNSLEGAESLTLDFAGLEYISSAGLRVLLSTQKQMLEKGKMKLIHVNPDVMRVFEMTGFTEVLTIEA